MRRQHLTQLIGAFVVVAVVGLPTVGLAGISGSAHDLTLLSLSTEICNACHTPHNADTTATGISAPLWDHEITATATFGVYSSATLDATPGQPSGVSKLCLSCHDGSVALDAFGGAGGTTTITGAAFVGTDLSDDHPISFTYDAALSSADGELFDPSVAPPAPLTGSITSAMLFSGNVECASCHDVHDNAGNASLLLVDNAGSALCLACHDK